MPRFSLLVSLALLLTLALVGSAAAQSAPVTVTLATQNNSGVSGTATLTPMGNQTHVVLAITGEPAGGSEPAHIHVGSCPTVGAVKYPLTNVVNGTSTTTVNAPLATLTAGAYAINVHQSVANIKTYVACGDIKAPASGAMSTSPAAGAYGATTTPTAAPAAGAGGLASSPAALPLALLLGAGFALPGVLGRRRVSA